ncbi:uncharacterized protein RBU57_008076 [Macrochelys suwanniensis]
MPGSPGFKPCWACLKPMPTGDPHNSCLKCLGESHLPDKCRIYKAFKPQTKKEQDFRLKQLLLEASLSPMLAPHRNPVPTSAAGPAPAALERPSSSKEPRHRTPQAGTPQRRRSMSPRLRKSGPGPALTPAPLHPQPVQDRAKPPSPAPTPMTPVPQGPLSSVPLAKMPAPPAPAPQGPSSPAPPPMPAPALSTPVPQRPLSSGQPVKAPVPTTLVQQGPLSSVTVSSPVHAEVELTLPSTPDTFSAARDLIAMTDLAPTPSSVPPLRIITSHGKPAMLRPVPHAEIDQQPRSPRRRSQSRHRSPSRRRSYSQHRSRSTSRRGRQYYDSRYRSRSHGWSQRRSPDDRPRYRSPRRTRSRSRYRSPAPRHNTAPRTGPQGHSAPPWPSRSASRSSRAGSAYYTDQGHVVEGQSHWPDEGQDPSQALTQWPFWTPMAYYQSQGAPSRASQSAHSESWAPEAMVSRPPPEAPGPAAQTSAEIPDLEALGMEAPELMHQDLPQDPLPSLQSVADSPSPQSAHR